MRDAIPLIASVVLAACSGLMIPSEPARGWFSLVFFGACALALGTVRLRRARMSATLRRTDQAIGFAAGTRLVVRPWGIALASLAFLALGLAFPFLFPGWIPVVGAILSGGLGGVGLVGLVLGRYRRTIEVRPDGLWVEESGRAYLLPWDGLEVGIGELSGHPTITLSPRTGPPVSLMPARYGIEAGAMAKALARYAADPRARDELVPRPALDVAS